MPDEEGRPRRKLSAILMADVSGFSRMMGRDEERTTELIQDFHGRVEDVVSGHEGRVVDTAGDSVFGEFDSVVNAVRCAHAIQVEQSRRNADCEPDERIDTRIGVHVGDVIVEDYRVYGDGVNVAARIEQIAEPGGILVSEAVFQQIHNKVDLRFVDVGTRSLKNIEYPVRLYRVAERDEKVPRRLARRRPRRERAPARATDWLDALQRTDVLVMVALGIGLLASPLVLFPTGGVFPVGGAVLFALGLGRAWDLADRSRGGITIALGIALGCSALLTRWSPATDALFLIGGLTLVAWGTGRKRKAS